MDILTDLGRYYRTIHRNHQKCDEKKGVHDESTDTPLIAEISDRFDCDQGISNNMDCLAAAPECAELTTWSAI